MRLIKKQRAEVVELLRCAADVGGIAKAFEIMEGIETLGAHYQPGGRANYPIWDAAVIARESVDADRLYLLDYASSCLEAAQRVEEGSWP